MFILKIKKPGIFTFRNKSIRSPCSLKIKDLNTRDLDLLEIRLRVGGFGPSDYELLFEGEPDNFEIVKDKPKSKESKDNQSDKILDEIKQMQEKINYLPYILKEIVGTEGLAEIISNLSSKSISKEKEKKEELEEEEIFIPTIDVDSMSIKSKVSSSKRTKTIEEANSAADALSSITKEEDNKK